MLIVGLNLPKKVSFSFLHISNHYTYDNITQIALLWLEDILPKHALIKLITQITNKNTWNNSVKTVRLQFRVNNIQVLLVMSSSLLITLYLKSLVKDFNEASNLKKHSV